MMKAKRYLALLLCLLMLVSLMPTAAFADDGLTDGETAETAGEAETPAEGSSQDGEAPAEGDGNAEEPAEETPAQEEAPAQDETPAEENADEDIAAESEEEIAPQDDDPSGTCGEALTWTLSGGVLTISGTGEMYSYSSQDPSWDAYCDEITAVVAESGVGSVGAHAFYGYTELTTVTLAASVSHIDDDAFAGCEALTGVSMPGVTEIGDGAFDSCTALANVTFADGLTSIGENAFYDCDSLISVSLPAAVASIGYDAFGHCDSMKAISVAEDNATYHSVDGVLFKKEGKEVVRYPMAKTGESYEIPSGVEKIDDAAFADVALKSVTIPASVTQIEGGAFWYAESITTVRFYGNAPTIGDGAFKKVQATVVYFDDAEGWTDETMLDYGGSLTWVAADRGACGEGVTWVYCAGTLIISGTGEIYSYSAGKAPWNDVRGNITELVINEGVSSVGDYAFYDCTALSSVTLPSSVTVIGESAFEYCYALEEITLPAAVETLGDEAFYECTALKVIEIPAAVTEIGYDALGACSSLTAINVSADNTAFCSVDGVLFDKEITEIIRYPEGKTAASYCIPSGVEIICDAAFSHAPLESVTIPSGIQTIEEGAFYYATGIETFRFMGHAPEEIENYAFQKITATAYYIGTAGGWTDEIKQNYGGSISWQECLGTCGDELLWTVSGTTLTVVGTGAMYDYDGDESPWEEEYSDTLTAVAIEEGATSVGNAAFYGFYGIKTLNLPSTLQTVGELSFYKCEGISSLTLPEGVKTVSEGAFGWCTGITTLTLPGTLEVIGEDAFYQCKSLTALTLPSGLKSIGYDAFGYCEALTSLDIPSNVESLDGRAFEYCTGLTALTLHEGLKSIGSSAFAGCSALTAVTIPASVSSIGNSIFDYCSGLTSITVADGSEYYCAVDGILFDAGMTALIRYPIAKTGESYTIPSGVETICDSSFANLTVLKSLTVPATVTAIESYAFDGSSITDVCFMGSAPTIGNNAFRKTNVTAAYPEGDSWTDSVKQSYGGNVTWNAYQSGSCDNGLMWSLKDGVLTVSGNGSMKDYTNGTYPWDSCDGDITSVIVGSGVTCIGSYAFADLDELTTVSVAATVTSVHYHAFDSCASLESVTLPEGLLEIGEFAFADCSALEELALPGTLTTIGDEAFAGCSALKSLTIPASVTAIGDEAFDECAALAAIGVEDGNENYSSVDGVLFNQNKTTLVRYPEGKTGEAYTIPSGVTAVDDYAFNTTRNLKELTVPAGVTAIGDPAFYGSSIEKITFRGSAPTIGEYAFVDVTATAYYPDDDASWTDDVKKNYGGAVTWVSYETPAAYGVCGDDLTWTLSRSGALTVSGTGEMYDYLPENAPWYAERDNLTSIVIGEGAESVGDYAFYGCTAVVTAELPSTAKTVGLCAFEGCSSLTDINISGSASLLSEDGVLYAVKNDALVLVKYPAGRAAASFSIKSGTSAIGDHAFSGSSVTDLSVPAAVTSVEEYAFAGSSLGAVRFEGKAPAIGENAFRNVTATAYYPGDDASWTDEIRQNYGGALTWTAFFSGMCGDSLAWVLVEGGALTISGTGEMYDYLPENAPWYAERDSFTSIVIGEGAESVGDYAFCGCTAAVTAELPSTAKTVGLCAFEGCSSLTDINVTGRGSLRSEDGVLYAVENDGIVLAKYPEGRAAASCSVVSGTAGIGDHAFSGSKVTDLSVPATVTFAEEYAFSGSAIGTVRFESNLMSVGEYAFAAADVGTVTFKGDETTIGDYAFDGSSLGAVRFEGKAPAIGENAFRNVTAAAYYPDDESSWTAEIRQNYGGTLTWEPYTVVIASGECGDDLTWTLSRSGRLTITGTGEMWDDVTYGWEDCSEDITAAVIGEGCTTIAYMAFDDFENMKTVSLPSGIRLIDEYAFSDCSALKEIVIPDTVETIGSGAFYECDQLTEIAIPASVTSLADDAFSDCDSLTAINVAADNPNYSSADGILFNKDKTELITCPENKSADSYTVPSTVTAINPLAFRWSRIRSITIPAGTASIGRHAFSGSSLKEIRFEGSAPSLGDYVFMNITATAYYPADDDSWTSDVRQSYGGTITWESYDPDSCGSDLTWTLTDGVLTVSGAGSMYDFAEGGAPWYSDAESIETVILEAGVTSVGENAFAGCTALKYVFFTGSSDDWSKVTVGGGNSGFAALPVHTGTTEHTPETDAAVAATCTKTGLTEGSHCSVCGLVLTAQQEVPLAAHTLTHVAAKAAKLSTDGNVEYWVCSVCGKYFLDESCTEETTADAVILPQTGLDAPVITGAYNYADYIKVVWNAVDGAESYRLSYRKGSGDWIRVCDTTGTRVNVTNLEDGGSYTFKVECRSKDGTTQMSGESNRASQIRLLSPAVTVTRFGKAGTVDGSGFRVSWNATEGGSCYKVYYREKGGSWTLYANYAKSNNTRFVNIKASMTNAETASGEKFPDLLIGHTYEFVVITATSQAGITSGFPTSYTGYKF